MPKPFDRSRTLRKSGTTSLSCMELYSYVSLDLHDWRLRTNESQRVHCQHGDAIDRDEFQYMLSETNPEWKEFADELERTGQKPRTNPDGDVGVSVPGSGLWLT